MGEKAGWYGTAKALATMIALLMCASAAGAASLDDLKKQIAQDDRALQAALTASDYDAAEQMYRKQLELLRANDATKSALYASLLHAHAAVLKHQFNFSMAQKEEDEARLVERQLATPTASVAPPCNVTAPGLKIPPPPAAAIRAAKLYASRTQRKAKPR
jgi:hypothetical protein